MSKDKAEKAYIIDFGDRGLEDVRKCVTFHRGIGILDHAGVAQHRPDIYGPSDDGHGHPRPSGQYARFELLALAEYFLEHGFTVTEISEAEADKFRKTLAAGRLPSKKYLKEEATTEVAAPSENPEDLEGEDPEGEGDEGESGPVAEGDLEGPGSAESPVGPAEKKGDKKGGGK